MVLWLGEPNCHRRELVGGKAANLSRLSSAYPVPPGFCLAAPTSLAGQVESPPDGLRDNVAAAYQKLVAKLGWF